MDPPAASNALTRAERVHVVNALLQPLVAKMRGRPHVIMTQDKQTVRLLERVICVFIKERREKQAEVLKEQRARDARKRRSNTVQVLVNLLTDRYIFGGGDSKLSVIRGIHLSKAGVLALDLAYSADSPANEWISARFIAQNKSGDFFLKADPLGYIKTESKPPFAPTGTVPSLVPSLKTLAAQQLACDLYDQRYTPKSVDEIFIRLLPNFLPTKTVRRAKKREREETHDEKGGNTPATPPAKVARVISIDDSED